MFKASKIIEVTRGRRVRKEQNTNHYIQLKLHVSKRIRIVVHEVTKRFFS